MVGPWSAEPYTFRALRKTFGEMWLRCDSCRRFAPLRLPPGYLDRDYRTVSFSCSVCGNVATHTVTHPHTEAGMADYREDAREQPKRHPKAEARILGTDRRPSVAAEFVPPSDRHKFGRR